MDATQFIALLGALTGLLIAATAALVQVVALRRQVNGRLTQLLELTARASHAEGRLDTSDVGQFTTPSDT